MSCGTSFSTVPARTAHVLTSGPRPRAARRCRRLHTVVRLCSTPGGRDDVSGRPPRGARRADRPRRRDLAGAARAGGRHPRSGRPARERQEGATGRLDRRRGDATRRRLSMHRRAPVAQLAEHRQPYRRRIVRARSPGGFLAGPARSSETSVGRTRQECATGCGTRPRSRSSRRGDECAPACHVTGFGHGGRTVAGCGSCSRAMPIRSSASGGPDGAGRNGAWSAAVERGATVLRATRR